MFKYLLLYLSLFSCAKPNPDACEDFCQQAAGTKMIRSSHSVCLCATDIGESFEYGWCLQTKPEFDCVLRAMLACFDKLSTTKIIEQDDERYKSFCTRIKEKYEF